MSGRAESATIAGLRRTDGCCRSETDKQPLSIGVSPWFLQQR